MISNVFVEKIQYDLHETFSVKSISPTSSLWNAVKRFLSHDFLHQFALEKNAMEICASFHCVATLVDCNTAEASHGRRYCSPNCRSLFETLFEECPKVVPSLQSSELHYVNTLYPKFEEKLTSAHDIHERNPAPLVKTENQASVFDTSTEFHCLAGRFEISNNMSSCPRVRVLEVCMSAVSDATKQYVQSGFCQMGTQQLLPVLLPVVAGVHLCKTCDVVHPGPDRKRELLVVQLRKCTRHVSFLLKLQEAGMNHIESVLFDGLLSTMSFPSDFISMNGAALILLYIVLILVSTLFDEQIRQTLAQRKDELNEIFTSLQVEDSSIQLLVSCFFL